ncbi:MAG: hypothetical protein ABJC13_03265 [Acidobacteriota bacterium]
MRRATAWGLATWIGLAGAAGAQTNGEPTLSAHAESAGPAAGPLTVGDRAVVTLELAVPAGPSGETTGEPRFPTWGKTWGDAEVVGVGPVERSAGGSGETTFRQQVAVRVFRTGKVMLPPMAVVVPQAGGSRTMSTPASLALDVSSVIPGDPKAATPKPPAAPRSLPWGRRFWWTFAGMSALAFALGLWVFARKKVAEIAAAALPPLEELERELARIAAGLGGSEGAAASARIAASLSSALRRYLGRELAFPALESTTTEIQRRLRKEQTPEGISRPGVDLLRRLDRIKFARRAAENPAPPEGSASEAMFSEAIAAARSVASGIDRHRRPTPAEAAVGIERAEAAR